MKFEGEYLDIMFEGNPEHRPNNKIEQVKKVIYVQVRKDIYRMTESALRWYELYTMTLKYVIFKINP